MPYHANTVGAELHVFARITGTDPGAIGAGKGWIDTSSGPPYQLKIRNSTDDGWEAVGVVGDFATGAELETVEDDVTALDTAFDAHAASTSNPHSVTAAQTGAEPALGNPGANGMVLASTAAGVRAWTTALTNPMTTAGDVIIGGASGTPTRLAKGGNNTVLGVDGSGVLGFKADPSGGGGGGSLTVEEEDGAPGVSSVTTLIVPNGMLVDEGGGVIRLSLAGLLANRLQLDAGTGITKDGSDLVSEWGDQFAYGNNVRQPTAANQPLWVDSVINSEPVVRFDGVDNYMSVPMVASGFSSLTLAVVVRPRDATATEGMVSWGGSIAHDSPFVLVQRNSGAVRFLCGGAYPWSITHATDATKLYVLTADGITWNLYVDGVAQSGHTAGLTSQSTATQFYLGTGFNGYAYVDIAAVELYSKVLSSGERGALTTRLMTKYGLS